MAAGDASREGRPWLTGDRLPALVVAVGLVPTLLTAWILWGAAVNPLTADRTALAARDFTAFWAAGRAAAEGTVGLLADPASFDGFLRGLFGPGLPHQIWPYPPTILLLARPLADIPLGWSFLAYTAAGSVALGAMLRGRDLSAAAVAAVLLSPAVWASILAGQTGAAIATMLAGGLMLLERRPMVAGLLLGGLCIKPQFAVLVPICLLAGRHGRAAIFSCMSAGSLAFLSLVCFGVKPWLSFFTSNRTTVFNYAGATWRAHSAQSLFSSVFMAARSLGAGLPMAALFQAAATVACATIVWRLWAARRGADGRVPATLALSLLAAPWVHVYDFPLLAIAIVLTVRHARGPARALLGFAWLWPGLQTFLPLSPAVAVLSVVGVARYAASAPTAGDRPSRSGSWLPLQPSAWRLRPKPPATSRH